MLGRGANRHAALPFRVPRDPVAHFPREVQPTAIVFEHVDDAEALFVVIELTGHDRAEDAFPRMPEWRVPEIVPERDGFGELFVQAQHFRNRARDLRHLERVREPRAVVIARRREEHLRLVLQPPECLGVDDAIAVALKRWTDGILGLGSQAAFRIGALRRHRRENLPLASLEFFADRHAQPEIMSDELGIYCRGF